MRPLKFRFWHPSIKEMLPDYKEGLPEWISINDFFEMAGTHYHHVVMQFTGLYDSHGKPIFEGDIVDNTSYGIGVIHFENGRFCVTPGFEWGHIESDVKIIGNIYQNPDLLPPKEK